jgi:hypothetical protein
MSAFVGRKEIPDVPMDTDSVHSVLGDIFAERERQHAKWGQQDHDIANWFLILAEEVGEAAKDACEFTFVEHMGEPDRGAYQCAMLLRLRSELIQVAAVSCAMVEAIERRMIQMRAEHSGGPEISGNSY